MDVFRSIHRSPMNRTATTCILAMVVTTSMAQPEVALLARMNTAEEPDKRLELLVQAAQVQLDRGALEDAADLAHAGHDEARRNDLAFWAGRCSMLLAQADLSRNHTLSALANALRALSELQGSEPRWIARANSLAARIEDVAGVSTKAIDYAEAARLAGALGNAEQWELLRLLARNKDLVGDRPGAVHAAQEALAAAHDTRDRATIQRALGDLARHELNAGLHADAIKDQRALIAQLRNGSSANALGIATNDLARMLALSGDKDEAVSEFLNAGRQLIGSPEGSEVVAMNLAVVLGQLGRFEQAHANVDDALRSMNVRGDESNIADALTLKAGLFLMDGQWADARSYALEARTAAMVAGAGSTQAQASEILIRATEAQGLRAEAQAHANELKMLQLQAERDARNRERDREQNAYRMQEQEKDLLALVAHEQRLRFQDAQDQLAADTLRKGIDLMFYAQELKDARLEKEALAREQAQQALRLSEAELDAVRRSREIEQLESQRTIQRLKLSRLDLEQKQQADAMAVLERSNEILQKDREVRRAEQRRARLMMWSSAVIAFIVAGFALFFWWMKRKVSTKNRLIRGHVKEIERINGQLAQTNADLVGSITYARHIQSAIVPTEADLQAHLPGSFIFFRPQSEVSGDLPFVHRSGERLYVAAIDCTGHGVPAAMLSFIAYYNMHQVIAERPEASSKEVLAVLFDRVRNTMRSRHGEEGVDDSMDMGLAVLDLARNELDFAGLHCKAILIQGERCMVLEGGLRAKDDRLVEVTGTHPHERIALGTGDRLALFSDGVIHQFGQEGKKFSSRRLREVLGLLEGIPEKERRGEFTATIDHWMGDTPQTDDMLLMNIHYTETCSAIKAA